jgi:hypothetical protein
MHTDDERHRRSTRAARGHRRAHARERVACVGQLCLIAARLLKATRDHLGPCSLVTGLDDITLLETIEDARRELCPLLRREPEDFIKDRFDRHEASITRETPAASGNHVLR